MNVKEKLYKFQMERYEVFKAQDPNDGNFDVVFDLNRKKLYAHKFMLCSASTTFKSMLSNRWLKSDEPIKIDEYSFDDFKEFLTFIYSGECNLTNDNIFTMVDMAEFYGVQIFKETCEEYLTKMESNLDNIYQMLELANKYFLDELKKKLNSFISNNASSFFKCDEFQRLQKSTVTEVVELNRKIAKQEEVFEAVYKWAENRISKTNAIPNMNDAIKKEISEVLPFFKFERMNYGFFVNFIVRKSFFSAEELSNILLARKKVYVKITDENGKEMEGELQFDEMDKIISVIESLKNSRCHSGMFYDYWDARQPFPSKPSKLIPNENVEWYLIYDTFGNIAVKHRNKLVHSNYLLAELVVENGFQRSKNSKIRICRAE